MTADLIITNTRVVTARADGAEAQAVAVSGNRIVAVGDPDAVGALAGPTTRIVSAAGGSVVPGLNDAHLHLQWWAFGRSICLPARRGCSSAGLSASSRRHSPLRVATP